MAIVAHCLKIGMKTNYYHLPKPMTIMMNEHFFSLFFYALWSHCLRPFSPFPLSFSLSLTPLHTTLFPSPTIWCKISIEKTSAVQSEIILYLPFFPSTFFIQKYVTLIPLYPFLLLYCYACNQHDGVCCVCVFDVVIDHQIWPDNTGISPLTNPACPIQNFLGE